ncbi:MAG: site-specific integrase [Candidatus Bathyarchaeota archaeon]|nr:MAG: site-specific integrase [Candidatus Bathyarchaeota archaeon]
MVSKGGYKRRSMYGTVPVSFQYIQQLVEKVDKTKYNSDLKLRNKALIVLLYYSARRISEIVGRTLELKNGAVDKWQGVTVKDFRFDTRNGRDIMVMRVRILKKGKAKAGSIRNVYREVIMRCDWPLMDLFLDWLGMCEEEGLDTKLFDINRTRAYQILKELDKRVVGNHWLRHQRLSHMAEHLNPFELNERIGFWERLDPAISYVHGRIATYLDAGDKAVQ